MRKPVFTASPFIKFLQRDFAMTIIDIKDFHFGIAAGTGNGIITKGRQDGVAPTIERTINSVFFR